MLTRAAWRAKYTLETGEDLGKFSVFKKAKMAAVLFIPCLFMFGVLALLVVGIFALFRLKDNVGWKIFVTVLALGIKILGNKILLGLLAEWPM
jgi:hypothetical protein